MSFRSLAFRSIVGLSLALAAVGCAGAEAEEESTEATADELNAEDLFCAFFQCEPGGGGSAPRWVKLGQEEVDTLFDRDNLDVDVNTRFRELQLRFRHGDVTVHDLDIHFRDGSRFSPDLDGTYRENSRSEIIRFPRAARIDSITIHHSKTLFGTGGVVEFWARR